jgi:putative transposase
MSTFNHTVTDREVHDQTHRVLVECFQVKDFSAKCPASMLVSLVLYAATHVVSLSAACRRLRGAPSDETARQALLATLPERLRDLERRANAGLAGQLPKALHKRSWPVAIDMVEIGYYGKKSKDSSAISRRKAKQGTTRAYKYATAAITRKGHRFVLAATPVERDESLPKVLQRLLARIQHLDVDVRYLLLDRQFYNVEVVRYLQRTRRPFVMPVVHRGRAPKDPSKSQSTRRFLTWRKSSFSSHTWSHQGRKAKVSICVSRRRYLDKQKRRQHQVLVFAYWGIRPRTTTWVRETYRKRFSIETSYRQVHQARPRTTSHDPLRRFLYVAVALILRNIWAWLLLIRLARHGKVQTMTLPFVDMLASIGQFIEIILECVVSWGVPKPELASG